MLVNFRGEVGSTWRRLRTTRWMPTSIAVGTNCRRGSRWLPTSIVTAPMKSSSHRTAVQSAFRRIFSFLWAMKHFFGTFPGGAFDPMEPPVSTPDNVDAFLSTTVWSANAALVGAFDGPVPSCWLRPISITPVQPRFFSGRSDLTRHLTERRPTQQARGCHSSII